MQNEELAIQKLIKHRQDHIIDNLKYLQDVERENLVQQILELDFEEIERLYNSTKVEKEVDQNQISPMNCIIDKEKIEDTKGYVKTGEDIIKNNQYAVVTMAGGQGTRIGFDGPKGTIKLNIGEKGKYIFEILTENLAKAKTLYGNLPYWYIMTSEQNNFKTIAFFEYHNYFGYDKEKVKFFKQDDIPMLTKEGKLVIENDKIKTAADGNGGVYSSLKKQKIIEDMKEKGIKWVYICGVDNIMVKPIDPLFIGLTQSHNMKIASKSITKNYPEEKVGVFCKKNDKPSVIEYIDLTEEMVNMRNGSGELVYGDANFISHLLSVDAIEKISKEKLEYHKVIKNNLYKYESFIFDGFKFLDDMLVMRVKRNEEFAPIKNKEGVDSPETAVEIYKKYNNN